MKNVCMMLKELNAKKKNENNFDMKNVSMMLKELNVKNNAKVNEEEEECRAADKLLLGKWLSPPPEEGVAFVLHLK